MHIKHRGISHMFARATAAAMLLTAPLAVSGSGIAAGGTCTSPRTTSPVYTGDHQSGVSDTNQGSWRLGTLAITNQPAADIVVSFKTASTQNNWRDSKPMSTKTASRILLKIGSGDVQFSTMYRANSGSSACSTAPATVFSPTAQPINSIAPNTTQPTWPSGSNGSTSNPSGGTNNKPSGGSGGGGGSY